MHESTLLQEIAAQAKVEQARKAVLEVLRLRFGEEASGEFQQAINNMQHLEQLNALLQLAVQSRGVSQFRKGMPRD